MCFGDVGNIFSSKECLPPEKVVLRYSIDFSRNLLLILVFSPKKPRVSSLSVGNRVTSYDFIFSDSFLTLDVFKSIDGTCGPYDPMTLAHPASAIPQ